MVKRKNINFSMLIVSWVKKIIDKKGCSCLEY